MARINITHTTEYRYRNPVGLTRHSMMLRPDDSHDLRLHHAVLKIDPEPSTIRWTHDVFNNAICVAEWPQTLRTNRLRIVSTLDLTHHPEGPSLPAYSLDPAAEFLPFSYSAQEIADLARLAERQLPDPERTVDTWARRFIAGPGPVRTLDAINAMSRAIKAELAYGARYEEGTQSAAQTLALGTGTCRDFAVLMMEAVRSLGLAARFVTGYLYDDTSGTTRGGGATHAWCSIYLPGAGWVEYDPTNGLMAGNNLIRVGVTRSAEQAIPVAGGYFGDANDFENLFVDVSVSAVPLR
ncbi:transglutaminase family protein [Ancylobacter sp. A5.8]|uniref:transglutaminase family protein n=1 Tax=Ancylobacter gelatini TaxID=2919920 RepID=UPI001F4E5165|nr:transglutaminase family protein [Ancylobacter gelatini]MCJ8143435.1 transglutaminase family protein [Ancylobacter gelatini]